MNFILRLAFSVCLFRIGPQDIPPSNSLLRLVFFTAVAVLTVSNWLLPELDGSAMMISMVDLVTLGGIMWLLLWITRKTSRWVQSCTALYAAIGLLHFLMLPLTIWLAYAHGTTHNQIPYLFAMGIGLWLFMVIFSILKAALEITWVLAFVLTFTVVLVNTVIVTILFSSNLQ